MAKGKYEYWLTADGLLRLEAYARDGLTDDDISTKLGINRSTLYDWIKKYPDISNALKRGKEVVDVEVENALLQKAMGIKETVQRAIKLKEVLTSSTITASASSLVFSL
jgi:transposase-like protein